MRSFACIFKSGLFVLLSLLAPMALFAETRIVTGVSHENIPLNITFDGDNILIYGAIDSDELETPDVIITVEGPKSPVEVHRKSRRFGLYFNTHSVRFDNAPSYLAIVANRPLHEIISVSEADAHKIGFTQRIVGYRTRSAISDPDHFIAALIRLRRSAENYYLADDAVNVAGGILFSSKIPLPADLMEGDYRISIHVLGGKKILSSGETVLPVYKSGIERWLYDLSVNSGFLYGLLAILIAVATALLSAQLTRFVRR